MTIISTSAYTPAEMDVLRRSAAQYVGTALPSSVEDRLKLCMSRFHVLRNSSGEVAGFGREGFVLTPSGCGLYGWKEARLRQAHIDESIAG